MRDLERTIGRLSAGSGNARDLVALRLALEQIPAVKKILGELGAQTARPRVDGLKQEVFRSTDPAKDSNKPSVSQEYADKPFALLKNLESQLTEMPDLVELISRAIVDDPPLAVKEGGMIRDGFDPALDELLRRRAAARIGSRNCRRTKSRAPASRSLKVRFNSVFGYYIEVTKSNLDKVPPHYIRKQTVANGERYITPELKEMEGKILGAEERSVKLEYELFQRVREEVLGSVAANPANRRRAGATRRARLLRRDRAAAQLLPPAGCGRRRAANPRRTASGVGTKPAGRTLRAE